MGTAPPSSDDLRVVPANEATWDDLQAILTGAAGVCQCERQRLGDHDWWHLPVTERASILRSEVHCGDPRASETIGIVGYLDDEPVAWCAVDRRGVYGRLRGSPVPWKERAEDKDDPTVWAIACMIVRKGYRGRGLTYPLVAAAAEYARDHGAAAVEGYPMLTGGTQVIWDEMNVGAVGPFLAAGFSEASHPTKRRVVMRLEF
ncbi:GNAT family N-acetyltransferase [Microbacterium terricola]|uniref:N-acetyltransferase n=1 Tax=Microbacterium terricola TaxID=344163 RepID=A0ABM8DXN5_9MICO|nr:GNAT family N-acetyltransferase [Microbacterium terricola]UYK38951.1 GNAT family N-acetyltransferase [Microbacterium terricola]BDV30349.1 N-acetyltransferase [Microbacterium terricola]